MSSRREDPYVRREEPPIMSSRREDPYVVREDPYVSRREDPYTRDIRGSARDEIRPPSPAPYRSEEKRNSSNAPKSRAEENIAFAQELRRMGATMEIYEAGHERKGKNAKELNVEKGDIVQVLDKSRNWWKLKNYRGETGYAPYTILKEYQTGDEYDNSQNSGRRLSGDYSSYINGSNPPPAPPPMGGSARPGTRNEDLCLPTDADSRQRKPADDKPRPVAPPLKQAPSSHNLRPHGEKSMYSPDLHKEIKTKMNVSDGSSDYSPRGRRRSQDPNWTSYEDPSPRGQGYQEPSPRGGRYIEPEPKVSPQRSPRYNDPRDQGYIDPSPRGQPGYPRPRKDINVSQYSTPDEIREWLDMKGFSRRCLELLQGYSGLDLFNLDKKEIERLVGREDGQRLYSLLEVQKVNANYRTRGRSELQAILQRRKEHTNTSDDLELGSRPSFMPDTPDYSPDVSDVSMWRKLTY
ncbi:ES8L2-like protein [Mya arenaria]|uniref:ES8L2-like protein n=1 Tax=Mya arenaria TaxID=6604 RepID=A0ABY7E0K7_MYAAR|nr:ES8L2-like protein [Mya arenaria]